MAAAIGSTPYPEEAPGPDPANISPDNDLVSIWLRLLFSGRYFALETVSPTLGLAHLIFKATFGCDAVCRDATVFCTDTMRSSSTVLSHDRRKALQICPMRSFIYGAHFRHSVHFARAGLNQQFGQPAQGARSLIARVALL